MADQLLPALQLLRLLTANNQISCFHDASYISEKWTDVCINVLCGIGALQGVNLFCLCLLGDAYYRFQALW